MDEQLRTLIGKPLDGFTIEEYVEIFQVDKDGLRVAAHGCLKDESLAQAFMEINGNPQYWHPADAEYLRTGTVLLLTDGTRAFQLGSLREVKLLAENEIRNNLQQRVREKISPAICSLLTV